MLDGALAGLTVAHGDTLYHVVALEHPDYAVLERLGEGRESHVRRLFRRISAIGPSSSNSRLICSNRMKSAAENHVTWRSLKL